MEGLRIKTIFRISFTIIPQNIDTIGFFCNLCACKIAVVIVSIAVKKTPIDNIDNSGAALFTEATWLGLLNSIDRIGFESTDIPIAHGIAMIAANFRHECITLSATIFFCSFSSTVFAVFTAIKDAVNAGVNEDAIG